MDAPVVEKDVGFNKPTKSLKANNEIAADSWMEIGPANLDCLGTPAADVATTVEVTLNAEVRDFQSDNLVPGATITVFNDQNVDVPIGVPNPAIADQNGVVSVKIPVGTKRFGYKMVDASSLDTLLLNQTVEPGTAVQDVGSINSVSKSTAQTLPALIGISRTPLTGVLAGAIRDCNNDEVSNFIATVTTTPARTYDDAKAARLVDTAAELGADTYYFSSSVGLPVRHTQKPFGSEDGLFMIVELPAAPTVFVQVWGYKTDADVTADNMSLIAELQTESVADTVITGSYEPLRTP